MRFAACPAYGASDVVRTEEHVVPEPDAGDVRIRVRAAAEAAQAFLERRAPQRQGR